MGSRDSRGHSSAKWAGQRRSGKGGASDKQHMRAVLESAIGNASLVIGIDPDVKNVGLCGWPVNDIFFHFNPAWVATTHVGPDQKGQQAAPAIFTQCHSVLSRRGGPKLRPLIVVEGQRIRRGPNATKNPQSIVDLAFSAGAALGAALAVWPGAYVVVVEPQAWKGSIKKVIHHDRILKKLGWTFERLTEYCRPVGELCDGIRGIKSSTRVIQPVNKADWKHIVDGIGLAKWGRDELALAAARLQRQGR